MIMMIFVRIDSDEAMCNFLGIATHSARLPNLETLQNARGFGGYTFYDNSVRQKNNGNPRPLS
jgi:hypothetical protein